MFLTYCSNTTDYKMNKAQHHSGFERNALGTYWGRSTDFTHFKPTKKLKNVVDISTALSGAIKSEHQIHYQIYQAVSVQEKRDVLLLYGALWTPVFIGFLQSVIHHQY